MADAMLVESWKLATITMWLDKLDNHEVIKLIGENFDFDSLWEEASIVNLECATRNMANKIPKNRDQGDQKDRVAVLSTALLVCLNELKARSDRPVFYVSSTNLFLVPGVIKNSMSVEPTVTARLDNIEKMVADLSKGFSDMKKSSASNQQQMSTLSSTSVSTNTVNPQVQDKSHLAPMHSVRARSKSPSVKRKQDEIQDTENRDVVQEQPWVDVVKNKSNQPRKPRPVQVGTSKVNVAGGEARPYDVVIGNTHPDTTEDILKDVLMHVSQNMPEEFKLEIPLNILEVECLTKPREDGSRIWSRTWRVQVPNKFRDHMLRPEAYPAGWTTRRYFPPKQQRPAVPSLNPVADGQPPVKQAKIQS